MGAERSSRVSVLRVRAAALLGSLVMLGLSGCFSSSGEINTSYTQRPATTYVVARGDTINRIASRYGVSVGRLMVVNGISDPRALQVGQTLKIPSSAVTTRREVETASLALYSGPRAERQFDWPVATGALSSGFGMRNGAMHEGVDIAAPAGTPIHAGDSGVVIFSGRLRGYGNTIIVQHDSRYTTVYAHEERNLVRGGERVERGQTIGLLGASGHTTGNNLHFEVRDDNVARNPLAYLPQPGLPTEVSFAGAGGS